MKSRAFILVALLCALLLLVSSTMAAETAREETKENKAKAPEQYGGRCRYGCCGGWSTYGCRRCCKTADEAEATEVNVDINGHVGGGYGGGYGGGGRGGGGGGGGRGGGGGGGGGGHCRYGCCGGYGRYCRCCYNPEEALAHMQNEN